MKILFIEWKSFGNEDMLDTYRAMGHTVISIALSKETNYRGDKGFESLLESKIRSVTPDYVFSFNYFPVVSIACHKADVPYVAWIYDCPYVLLYSYTVSYPCNHIYVFDKELCLEFNRAGIETVHYLPMAVNTDRLDTYTPECMSAAIRALLPKGKVSFIGSMYTEKHQFYERLQGITDYTKGYLEGIMEAQQKIYGYNFIEELMRPDILMDLERILPMSPNEDGAESIEYLYAQYVVNRKITGLERTRLLSAVGRQNPTDVYTPDQKVNIPGIIRHAPIDYYDTAPYIMKHSKINLNISLRSIKSGIPLRAFDIFGCGGFLLTNYQADFLDYFVPGEDFEYYESEQDLLGKISYYLENEEERSAIALNGYRKVAAGHTFKHRIREWEAALNHS